MVRVELEDVGVHLEYEQVAGDLQLGLELAAVAVFDADSLVEFVVQLVVHLRGDLDEHLLQEVERREGVVEDVLLQGRFGDYRGENLLAQRGVVHIVWLSVVSYPMPAPECGHHGPAGLLELEGLSRGYRFVGAQAVQARELLETYAVVLRE